MDRRRFLSLGILSGLTAGVSMSARRLLHAQPVPPTSALQPYTGRFFLMVHAGGGWDPTMVCDPKGGEINRGFTAAQIGRAGNLAYAPVEYAGAMYSNRQFFEKFHSRLLVLNGVDTATVNHDSGTRYTWSGHLEDGYPPLAALIAASLAPGKPLAFLSNGGYDNTVGVVPLTRLNDLGTVSRIAYPNRRDPTNRADDITYHSQATADRIRRFQNERLAAMAATQTLPTYASSMQQLLATRRSGNLLERLLEFLPTNEDLGRYNNPIARQGLVALGAYQAGVCAAANLTSGGFDTHGNHDMNQGNALGTLLRGVDMIMDRIDMLGLTDRVAVIVSSDFGRTPRYNAQNGKDHWSVTSALLMGPGIRGDRVIGASDDGQRARGLDYSSLQVSDSSPRKLTPKAIHTSLRRYAGVENSEVTRQFPIYGDSINLFA